MTPPSGIWIFQNGIVGNGGLGINLVNTFSSINTGVDVNDAGDPDSGPNGFQNYPVVSAAANANATQTLVAWSLNSTASTIFSLEFFSSPTCSASGNGEGQTYLGSADIATDASGNATGSAIVSPSTVAMSSRPPPLTVEPATPPSSRSAG